MCLCFRGRRRSLEEKFPHHNWPIVILTQLSLSLSYFVLFTPSIYQFVTTPRSRNDQANDSCQFWPGLGGTEGDYGLVSASPAIFELLMFPTTTFIIASFPFILLMLLSFSIFTAGGVMYAVSTRVWMVFLARGFMGMASILGMTVMNTYIGEVGTHMDQIRYKQQKKPRKHFVYIALMLSLVAIHIALLGQQYSDIIWERETGKRLRVTSSLYKGYGINAALVRIPSVDPYRLPAWCLTAMSLTSAIIVLIFFSETRPWTPSLWTKIRRWYSLACSIRLTIKLRSRNLKSILKTIFVIVSSYSNGQAYTLLLVLISPVLSDQFGFTVANSSLFFVVIFSANITTVIILLVSAALKGSNRILVAVGLLMNLIGCGLIGDWQAIFNSGDLCSLHYNTVNDSSSQMMSATCLATNATDFQSQIETCKGVMSYHECFWNPQSRVTGDYCNTCIPACLSYQISLNFYQFGLGVILITSGCYLLYTLIPALISDIYPIETQGTMMSVSFGTYAVSRIVVPLWYVASYERTGKHTYIPASVNIALIGVTLVLLLVIYKTLAPIHKVDMNKTPTQTVTATNAAYFRSSFELLPALFQETANGTEMKSFELMPVEVHSKIENQVTINDRAETEL